MLDPLLGEGLDQAVPIGTELTRAYRYPRTSKRYQWESFDPAGNRQSPAAAPGFTPGVVFDMFDQASNRLGYGTVGLDGAIELFDSAGNRLGLIRPAFYGQNDERPRGV